MARLVLVRWSISGGTLAVLDTHPTRLSLSSCDHHAISRGQAFWLAAGCCAGSMVMTLLFDPRQGRRRRALVRDRGGASLRRLLRGLNASCRGAAADAFGLSHRMAHHPAHDEVSDDETLTQRVESQLFRDRHIPKGDLNITAEYGLIVLRGELESPAEITRLEDRVRRVDGVRGVQNLLHPRGTPAPNKERSRLATI
jgi:hypothetical protein